VIFLLVAFDLEGTLLDTEFFPEVGRALEIDRTLEWLTYEAMNGNMGFEECLSLRFDALRGMPFETVEAVCASLPLVKGAVEAIRTLRSRRYVPAIISGGFEVLADIVARRLGITIVCANRLVVEGGRLEAIRRPYITPRLKADLLVNIAGQLGTVPGRCVAVGDGANDIPMLEAAGLGISFNGKECVREKADVIVEGEDIAEIVPIILEFSHRSERKKRSARL
jgi:phosphoserine phosphatase